METYLILLLVAGYLNVRSDDWRMMAMCVAVGFGISVPIPDLFFYQWCALAETFVGIFALSIRTSASLPVFSLSLCLGILHFLGYKFDGYPAESPYHFLVTIAEHAELVACIVFSKPFLGRLSPCRQNKSHTG
jgi:hypothetical protein